LRQEIARIRHEARERENYWRALWQSRKTGHGPDSDDLPPTPPAYSPSHSQPSSVGSHMTPSHINQYSNDNMGYRTGDNPSSSLPNGHYPSGTNHAYPTHSPALSFAGAENDHMSGDPSAQSLSSQRGLKYAPYTYPIQGSTRSAHWSSAMAHKASPVGESAPANHSSSHSPTFVESPTLTSSTMSYVGRFPGEDQKMPLNNIDTAPYVFPNGRSHSPNTSTPSTASVTPPLTSSFQFTFPEGSIPHDRSEFEFRRQGNNGPEVTLHGGTADISLAGSSADAVRYRLGARRSDSGGDRPFFPTLQQLSSNDNGSPHERGSSEGDSNPHRSRLRPRRDVAPSQTSRSPSPSGPPISGTLAVIKAQAFGALRRARARTKKLSEREAAKAAMVPLESRGIGMGVSVSTGSKRPRHQTDDMDV
jgi:hypothetical protein